MVTGALTTACTPFGNSSPFWGTMRAGISGASGPQITREYSDKLPYASMLARFKGAPQALLVLAEISPDGRWTWASAENQTLTTFGPFVVSALGFDVELRGTIFGGGWKADPLAMVGAGSVRTLDVFAEGERVQVPLRSTFERGDIEQVEILGRDYRLQKVVERVSSGGRARYRNQYHIDPATRRCWRAVQTVVPTLPPLITEILKYPA